MATAFKNPSLQDLSQVDASILSPLASLKGGIRRYVALEGMINALLFVVVWFWIGLFLDYGLFALFGFDWVEETGTGIRAGILIAIVAALLAIVVSRIAVRLMRDFSAKSLALVLERRFPQLLGDRLITAVELSNVKKAVGYGYSEDMILKTIADVRERVARLPVSQVFNWRRLYLKFGLLLGVLIGGFLLVGVGYSILFLFLHMKPSNPDASVVTTGKLTRSFTNLAGVWFKRNILLQNTHWPRRTYMELLDFPANQTVVHLGPNRFPYSVKSRGYKWVWVDPSAPQGLRAMTWADAGKVVGKVELPDLPFQKIRNQIAAMNQAALMAPAPTAFYATTLQNEIADFASEADKWPLDRVEELLGETNLLTNAMFAGDSTLGDKAKAVFAALETKAEDPYSLRTFRRLNIPEKAKLSLRGRKTWDDIPLNRGKKNTYIGEVGKPSESVDFRIVGGDYSSPKKRIELVPAPTIVSLKRTEYQPAYLYYFPVIDDSKPPLFADPRKLKGMRQKVEDLYVSLSDKKSRIEIPAGTELTLTATVDKTLREAFIVVFNPARFPGMENAVGMQKLPLSIDSDGKTVHFDFKAEKGTQILRTTDFTLEFHDTDDVSAAREIQIQPVEDPLAEVGVDVETIRRMGTVYMCTPKALIPFAKESKIKDFKGGLNRVEYRYSFAQLESTSDLAAKAGLIGLIFHNSPQSPSIAQGLYKTGMIVGFNKALRSDLQVSQEQGVLLKSFQEEWEKRATGRLRTVENLQKLLNQPLANEAERDRLIQVFDFNVSGNSPEIGFDLERVLPNLAVRDPESTPQPSYLLTLSVVATDNSVEGSEPRIATNKEPLIFRVVSHIELLGEIAREQSDLSNKLEEVIRRLEKSQKDLFVSTDRIRSSSFNPANRDDYLPEQSRLNEILETLSKSRDLTSEIAVDYARILKELIVNRFDKFRQGDKTIKDIRDLIVSPLQDALKTEYPKSEESLTAVQSKLNQAVLPDQQAVAEAHARLSELINRLRAIRAQITDTVRLDKLIVELKQLIASQTLIGTSVSDLIKQQTLLELAPILKAPKNIVLAPGEKKTVAVDLEWIITDLGYPYSLTVVLPADSDLKVPSSRIDVKGSPLKVNIEFTAGTKKGEFPVRIVPALGKAIEVMISVK